jgi:uncharacterized protein (DUF1697 family)
MGKKVALLRAVNVGGRKLPMADLRALCTDLGWADVETYIQSGNILFRANGRPAALEEILEEAIEKRFGFKAPAIVRTAEQWAAYSPRNPFPEAARDEPNRLMLLLSKQRPAEGAENALEARAADGERIRRIGDAVWIHFPEGAGTSKLSPTVIDRAIGSPATARNHRTVLKLEEMLGDGP